MARDVAYRQCTLVRSTADGEARLVTWIPERAEGVVLEPGVTLRIAPHGSKALSEERWTVATVGTETRTAAEVRDRAHKWRHYRDATDT